MRDLALTACAFAVLIGCHGTIGGDEPSPDPRAPDATPGERGTTDAQPAGPDAGPACKTGENVGPLREVAIAAVPAKATAFLAATDGGVVVAWLAGGDVHVQAMDLDGVAEGAELTRPAAGLYGLATSSAGHGLLVMRGSDELHLLVVGGAGEVDHQIMGGVDHKVVDNEWFGELIRAGRLAWNGTSWVAYYTVQRLWKDNVAHYGDALRYFAANGDPGEVAWDWGCSHSLDVRLAVAGSVVSPLCAADCYPGKGVYFDHDHKVFEDASGDCAGKLNTTLGGVAPVTGRVLTAFASPVTRASLDVAVVPVTTAGAAGKPVWLTATAGKETDVHIAPFRGGAVVGWRDPAGASLLAVDAAGAATGAAQAMPAAALTSATDFVAVKGGGVAWLSTAGGGALHVLSTCP